jgi:hypothetical protein
MRGRMTMKFKNILLSAVVAATVLTGCGAAEDVEETADTTATEQTVTSTDKIKVADEYQVMLTGLREVFVNNMTDKESSYLESYYGISPENVSSYMLLQAEDVMLADTVVVVKLNDGVNVDDIKAKFETVKENTTEQYKSYSPEQSKIMGEAVIGSKGDYVYFTVASNSRELANIIEKNIK